jgi:GNAT superfamily N-acetyltransferase
MVIKYRIDTLDASSPLLLEACVTLLVNAFAKPERYSAQRLNEELHEDSSVFYRKFYVAVANGVIVGVGGIKAADWASNTHLLYLSAVAPEFRGQGIGRALLKARVEWVEKNFESGRILVSSTKAKRFHEFGFVDIRKSIVEGRHLMMRRFGRGKNI